MQHRLLSDMDGLSEDIVTSNPHPRCGPDRTWIREMPTALGLPYDTMSHHITP